MFLVLSGKDLISVFKNNYKRVKYFDLQEDMEETINSILLNTVEKKEEFFAVKLKKISDKDFKKDNIKNILSVYKIENQILEQNLNIVTEKMSIDMTEFEDNEVNLIIDKINTKINLLKSFKYIFKKQKF